MSKNLRMKSSVNIARYKSAWSFREALIIRIWELLWACIFRWTPKKMNCLRLLALKIFGAKVYGRPFIFSSARIYAPFNLELHDHACVGPLTNIYSLGKIVLRKRSVISQECMLCGGTHDLASLEMPLLVGDIEVGEDVFIGARAIVLPGIVIGDGAVVGAGAVVTNDVQPWTVVGGNPAKFIKMRTIKLMKNDEG